MFFTAYLANLAFQECNKTPYREKEDYIMALRKQFQSDLKLSPEVQNLLEEDRHREVTDEELREQRVSFAFGNAPADAKNITKASMRTASQSILMRKHQD